ncbi:hypothetical protein [Streptomyces subrutilus]|uniref:Uncharacterized protein n=1 Tax=Streptomyces subrutilus TaxID=36818 RepID=A0A1E5P031_9ACTN|nr:hypothetical protein [Streptomyces subrutilus]OEJ22258.1 hypothetical protein BGK67_32285 [Streptomyces subrutilus]
MALTLPFVAPLWAGRARRPGGAVFRFAQRRGLLKTSAERAAHVVRALGEQIPAGGEAPDVDRLRQRLDDRRCSILSILTLWLFPYLGVVAALFVLLNGRFGAGYLWMVLVWGMFGGVLVLADVDRRMLARSLPLEHTTFMAVQVVEACLPPEPSRVELRGRSRVSAICASVDDLCAALGRQANLEPRRTDALHRARLRAEALEVVRNFHAAKIRLVEGDQAALGTLYAVIGSLLTRTVAPTHLPESASRLVAPEVLSADESWEGPPLRNESAGAKALGYVVFIVGLAGFGYVLSLLNLPEPLAWALLILMAGAGHRVLNRWLPVPTLPTELSPTAVPAGPSAGEGGVGTYGAGQAG